MSSIYYIDADSGSDANDGSESNPWETLGKSITESSSGDTIIVNVATASYSWEEEDFGSKNLTIEGSALPSFDPITQAWTAATFEGASYTTQIKWKVSNVPDSMNITNLVFHTGSGAVNGTYSFFQGAGNGHDLTFTNCVWHNISPGGTTVGGITGYTSEKNNGSITFIGCLGYDIDGCVISSYDADGDFVYNIQGCIFKYSGYFFTVRNADGDNTLNVTNTICYSESGEVDTFNYEDDADSFTYNLNSVCIYGHSDNPGGTNIITSDPKFIDPANGDFRLQGDSPCIGAGDSV